MLSTTPERLGFKPRDQHEDEDDAFPQARQEIEEGLQKLETLLNATVDKNFDKFEIYLLRNILSVPSDLSDWVRLKHYDGVSFDIPRDAPTADSIHLLRRKVAASRTVSKSLMQEQARNEALLQELRVLHQPGASGNLAFLTQSVSAKTLNVSSSNQALTTNATFAMSQLPTLKSMLAELRPRMATLKTASTGIESAKDEIRQERREYIEQRTQGLVDRNGRSSDDAAALSSMPVDTDDIQALERVAQIFKPA